MRQWLRTLSAQYETLRQRFLTTDRQLGANAREVLLLRRQAADLKEQVKVSETWCVSLGCRPLH